MSLRVVPAAVVAAGLLWLTGCGPDKLNVNHTLSIGGETPANSLELSAQKKPQTINVEFTSPAEVSVFLFKEDDVKGEDGIVTAKADKALGKAVKSKQGSFSAEVPANTATRVVARDARGKADVQLKITNK